MSTSRTTITATKIELAGDHRGTLLLLRHSVGNGRTYVMNKAQNAYIVGVPDKPSLRDKIKVVRSMWRWL